MSRPVADRAQGESGPNPGGLDQRTVTAWRRRLSGIAGGPVGEPDLYLAGAEAIEFYQLGQDVQADEPQSFEVYLYTSDLSLISSSFAALRSPVTLSRLDTRARPGSGDELVVGTVIDHATTRVESGNRRIRYRPGELILTGSATSYVHLSDDIVDSVGVVIPRRLLGRRRAAIEHSWQPLVSGSLLARATASFITSFAVPTATGVGPKPSTETELAVVDLIVSALGELTGISSSLTDNPIFVREAVVDVIERRYADPEFGVDAIAAELHLSRRQAYRYFEDSGQSLAGRIAERRIRAATDILRAEPRSPIGAVARKSGFTSVATFRNRFRARLGIGPAEYRALLLSGQSTPPLATED